MKQQDDNLSISGFEALRDKQQIREYVENHTKDNLVDLLLLIKEKRAVTWKDRAILQIVEKSPLTLWASNKAYKVVLWAGTCKKTYKRDLLGRSFYEIMSIYERSQAMEDSISVIEADDDTLGPLLEDFKNYYTKDMAGTKANFSLITNSMQLVDDETGEKYYAEIGLPIDLKKALAEHEERQRAFIENVDSFKNSVAKLTKKFSAGKDELLSRINKEGSLDAEQKETLRKQINAESATITSDLKKSDMAPDFEKFLQDNGSAIDFTLQRLGCEIDKAIEQLSPSTSTNLKYKEDKEDPAKLKCDIEHMIETVQMTIDAEIEAKTSVRIADEDLKQIRKYSIIELQNKRDELIRDLSRMIVFIDSSPDITLKAYRSYINEIESTMRKSIDDTTHKEGEGKNVKKRR